MCSSFHYSFDNCLYSGVVVLVSELLFFSLTLYAFILFNCFGMISYASYKYASPDTIDYR